MPGLPENSTSVKQLAAAAQLARTAAAVMAGEDDFSGYAAFRRRLRCEGVRAWSKRTSDAVVLATTATISSSLPWPTRLEGIPQNSKSFTRVPSKNHQELQSTTQYSPTPQDLTFRQATRCLGEIGFGIPKVAVLDYVERRWILARSRAFTGYMTDMEGFIVWK